MIKSTLERVFFLGALAALANGHAAHLDGDLAEPAEQLVRRYRPRARA